MIHKEKMQQINIQRMLIIFLIINLLALQLIIKEITIICSNTLQTNLDLDKENRKQIVEIRESKKEFSKIMQQLIFKKRNKKIHKIKTKIITIAI